MRMNLFRFAIHNIWVALFLGITIATVFATCLRADENSKVNENLKQTLDEAHTNQPIQKIQKYRIQTPHGGFGVLGKLLPKDFLSLKPFFEVLSEAFEFHIFEDGTFHLNATYSQNQRIPFYAGVPIFRTLEGQIVDTPNGKSLNFTMMVTFAESKFLVSNTNGDVFTP